MTAAATGQTRRLRSLNEEVKRLRILIRNLNKLLTAIMEGSITLGQDVFGEFLIENLANLATVSEEQKVILKIYVRFAYGGTQPTLTIPFYLAKKHGLFRSSVIMSEVIAQGEYRERREEFREKRREDMRKELERLRYSVRQGEEYIEEYDRTHTHMAGLPKFKEYIEEERWLAKNRKDRDDLEQNFETKLEAAVQNFDNSFDYHLLRKELVPKDFTTRIDPAEKDNVMRACIKELDTAGHYFNWLTMSGVVTERANPMRDIKNARITSPLPEILFEEECKRLLTAASADPRTYLLFFLLLETGIKLEELFTLRISHFYFSNRYSPEMYIKHTGKKEKKPALSPPPS